MNAYFVVVHDPELQKRARKPPIFSRGMNGLRPAPTMLIA